MRLITILLIGTLSASAASYYASPTGGGTGASPASPATVTAGLALLSAGDTLNLMDGTYTGASGMIDPPDGLSGVVGSPITVQAINDGQVLIDGQAVRRPVNFQGNSFWVLQGFNARNGSDDVIHLNNSNSNIVQRVCAWDTSISANADIFWCGSADGNASTGNLFEDCAAWGTARKTYSASQGGNSTIWRRCLGIWQGSTSPAGPKMTFSTYYNSTNILAENCIAMWDASRMPNPALITDAYGTFSRDHFDVREAHPGPYLYGCVSFLCSTQTVGTLTRLFDIRDAFHEINGFLQDCAGYVGAGVPNVKPFWVDSSLSGKWMTSLSGGSSSDYGSGTYALRLDLSADPSGIAQWKNMFTNTVRPALGAWFYYRYQDKVLTATPLWPWPMNARIQAITGMDVTALITGSGAVPPSNLLVRAKNLRIKNVVIK